MPSTCLRATRAISSSEPGQGDAGAAGAGGGAVHALKSVSDILGSFLTKAAIAQISLSSVMIAPKLGMPVMLMPFFTTQKMCRASRSLAMSFKSGGSGCSPSENFAQSTPGPPWQLAQPRVKNARAPACTTAGSSSDIGGVVTACLLIEAFRTKVKAQATTFGSGWVPATL